MGKPLIIGKDEAVEAFLDEWYSPSSHIRAHTSGSTGAPKDISLDKADMIVSAKATCRFFGIDSSSHLVMPLSATYIAGKMMIVRAIVSGAKLTVLPPSRMLSDLGSVNERIDLLPIVPTQIDGLLGGAVSADIRNVIVGGAPMSDDQEHRLMHSGVTGYATYGMTETCSHVALRKIGHTAYFEAMPDISFSVDSDNCLIIEAPGYTGRRFETNDVVELVDERHFCWLGRRDNVINSGGIKIIPETVEGLIRPYFGDLDFYLTSRRSDIWGEEMVMVVATKAKPIEYEEIIKRMPADFSHHLLPKDVICVTAHVYTTSGKLIRKKF